MKPSSKDWKQACELPYVCMKSTNRKQPSLHSSAWTKCLVSMGRFSLTVLSWPPAQTPSCLRGTGWPTLPRLPRTPPQAPPSLASGGSLDKRAHLCTPHSSGSSSSTGNLLLGCSEALSQPLDHIRSPTANAPLLLPRDMSIHVSSRPTWVRATTNPPLCPSAGRKRPVFILGNSTEYEYFNHLNR